MKSENKKNDDKPLHPLGAVVGHIANVASAVQLQMKLHSGNAISVSILFLFIVLNIFNIFFVRNIKDKRIASKSFLIDLIKAEFILVKWRIPISV